MYYMLMYKCWNIWLIFVKKNPTYVPNAEISLFQLRRLFLTSHSKMIWMDDYGIFYLLFWKKGYLSRKFSAFLKKSHEQLFHRGARGFSLGKNAPQLKKGWKHWCRKRNETTNCGPEIRVFFEKIHFLAPLQNLNSHLKDSNCFIL